MTSGERTVWAVAFVEELNRQYRRAEVCGEDSSKSVKIYQEAPELAIQVASHTLDRLRDGFATMAEKERNRSHGVGVPYGDYGIAYMMAKQILGG